MTNLNILAIDVTLDIWCNCNV